MAIFKQLNTVPFYCGFIVIGVLCGLYAIVYLIDNILPKGLTLQDETANNDTFIAERAQWILKNLTANGPRITGSDNTEVITVNYLTGLINGIINEADNKQVIHLDVQTVSGAYYFDSRSGINSYNNVQNVVVKVHSANDSDYSVLVNSHFDSVPTSPGASDDGINVAAMLEILRVFSHSTEQPLHNIVFLFNGAEETPMQAAHGFITQHPWAKQCKVVVNLEAVGSTGKIILFQNGPETPWLLKYYRKVPYPNAQLMAEEIFQSGYIPSDTDFRIFRDFGGLAGYDNAFYKDGHRYHTKFDREDIIPLGSYQHVGANILSLLRGLSNAPELSKSVPTEGKSVYFDFLGWFLVSYNQNIAIILNVFAITLSVGVFLFSLYDFDLIKDKYTVKYLGATLAAILGSFIEAAVFVLIVAVILDLLGKTMSWYANPWLIFGLYIVPVIALSGSLLIFVHHDELSTSSMCQIQAHLVRIIYTVILLAGICVQVRSVYILMVSVLFNSLGFVVIHVLRWHWSKSKWLIVYCISLMIPTMMLMKMASNLLDLFIPTVGRLGSNLNPEIILGFFTLTLTLLVTLPFVIFANSLRRIKYYYVSLALIFVVFFILVFTAVGFPYSGSYENPAPQRHRILYTQRKFYNENGALNHTDSGFFFRSEDRNSLNLLKQYVKELNNEKSVTLDCDKYLNCGVPSYHFGMETQTTNFVESLPPNLPDALEFQVTSKTIISSTVQRYSVTVSGPDKISVYLSPKDDLSLLNISLIGQLGYTANKFKNRPVYEMHAQFGKGSHTLTFNVDVQVPEDFDGVVMDVAVSGRWVHEEKFVKTPQYIALMKQVPDWAHVEPSMAAYHAYVV